MTGVARVFLFFAAFTAALAPAPADAHSSEFILAKVTPLPGRVQVELTADYGGNPMLGSEAEARVVLSKILRIRNGGEVHDLSALAPLRFEKRTKFDPTAPIPLDPSTGAEPHQLLWAAWSWKCASNKVAFTVPEDIGQSLILWTTPASTGKPPRWVFLLPGEVSPEIAIPPPVRWPWWAAGFGLAALGGSVSIVRCWRRRRKAGKTDLQRSRAMAIG